MSLLLRGGTIVDGTGRAPYRADIRIERDTIQDIGSFPAASARQVIDVEDLTVAPGLIDCHTHSELSLMRNPQHPAAVYSGISTVVTGLCGLGFAPIPPDQFDTSIRMNAGIFADELHHLPRWSTFAEYLSCLDGCAVNVASCVPHNAVRQMAVGLSDAPLTGGALKTAQKALDTALSEGGVAFSVGLSYYPGTFGDTEELVNLCRVVKEHDALFCVHSRLNIHGPSFDPLQEIAEVVERTGVRLHMLHYATSRFGNMGNPTAQMAPFADIVQKGATVTYEYYPYQAGAGFVLIFLPGWAQTDGHEAIMARLTDPALRQQLLSDIAARYDIIAPKFTKSVLSHTRDPYSGSLNRAIEDIAEQRGETVQETILSLLIENELELGFHSTEQVDETIRAQLFDDQFALFSDDSYTIGSDTIPTGEFCHPRMFGTYPRILRQARERGMPIEKAIHKLTAFPARIFRQKDRGTLEIGKKADICAFNAHTLTDTATFDCPRQKPVGMEVLLVNGKPALRDGGITGLLMGRALKMQ